MTTSDATPRLVALAVAVFGLGLLALTAIVVLFVTGHRELPLWLSAAAGVLLPAGLLIGLVGLLREALRR